LGPAQSFDPRFNSGGVRGAISYLVPESTFRLELSGSYVAGSGSVSQTTALTNSTLFATFLNGTVGFPATNCSTLNGFTCTVNEALSTSYSAWQANGKVAYDVNYGSLTVTPSAALFGGNSHYDQALTQVGTEFGGVSPTSVNAVDNYVANTSLRYADVGARLGLDTSVAVTSMLKVGIGGWVGVAGRHTWLSGTDTSVVFGSVSGTGASAIAASDTTTAVLANAEAGFRYKLSPTVTFRGFAGVNYDSKVPGITSRTFGSLGVFILIPAGIFYAHETNYYAGVGLNYKFGNYYAPVVTK
jgi:hypothetical protein